MARPSKIQRYSENYESDIVLEPGKELFDQISGNWREKFFKNNNPITLELACGKGEYTIGLARKFPERNFIGVDMKGDRIWNGSQHAANESLHNVCFVRSRIEMLPKIFAPSEVNEIWLTFPDPRPKDRDEKRRLNNLFYLNMYRTLLDQDGWFRFKTDNTNLFEYGLTVIEELPTRDLEFTRDLYDSDLLGEHHGLLTKYEEIWTKKGEKIKYLKCRFDLKLSDEDSYIIDNLNNYGLHAKCRITGSGSNKCRKARRTAKIRGKGR